MLTMRDANRRTLSTMRIHYRNAIGWRAFFRAILSSMSLLGSAIIPLSESVEKLTGSSANPLLRFIAKLRLTMVDRGTTGLIVLIGLWILYRYYLYLKIEKSLPDSKVFFGLSFVFAIISVVGMSFQKFDSLVFVIGSKFQVIYNVFLIYGFTTLFYALFEISLYKLRRNPNRIQKENRIWKFLLDDHPALGPICVLLAFWIPYWIAYFPGSAMWDAFRQLNYYFGIEQWSDHHPVLSTMIYGALMELGRILWNDNTGVFLCALFQHILLGGSIAYSLYCLRKWKAPLKFRILILAFFALCPIVAFWPHSIMKDVSFDALILIYATLMMDIILDLRKGKNKSKQLLYLSVTGILASLMRHNGIYIVFGSLIVLACIRASKKVRIKIVSCAVWTLICVMIIPNILMESVGAVSGSTGLALSLPFQQTARYIKEHGDEVTETEREAISNVLDYERLAELYDPDISDPVKGTYKNDDSQLPKYFKAWFQMFLKHPLTYIEATLSNSYSYFYPNGESTTKPLVYNSITTDQRINTGYFDIHYSISNNSARNFLNGILYVIKKAPGIGLICHMGTYTWILLTLIAVGIHKKKRYLLIGCVPALLNFLSCVASPVNGYLRYFLPNVLMIPVLIGWFTAEISDGDKKEIGKDDASQSCSLNTLL